jgi:glutamate-1-semialdehyde 2,1-aminomutase
MAAGLAMLPQLDSAAYQRLDELGARLESGVRKAISSTGISACIQRVGSAFTLFFCAGPVTDFTAAKTADTRRYAAFFQGMLDLGFYLPPAQLEAAFISLAHKEVDIDSFVSAAQEILAAVGVLR